MDDVQDGDRLIRLVQYRDQYVLMWRTVNRQSTELVRVEDKEKVQQWYIHTIYIYYYYYYVRSAMKIVISQTQNGWA